MYKKLVGVITGTVMLSVILSLVQNLLVKPPAHITNIYVLNSLCDYIISYESGVAKVRNRSGNVLYQSEDASEVCNKVLRDNITICFASSETVKHRSTIVIENRKKVKLISYARHKLEAPYTFKWYGENPARFIAIVKSEDIDVIGFNIDENKANITTYAHSIFIADSKNVRILFNNFENGAGKAIVGWYIDDYTDNVTIAFNRIYNYSQPLKFQRCRDILILGNTIENSEEQGIELDIISRHVLALNIFRNIGRTCIEVTNTTYSQNLVVGNILDECGCSETTHPSSSIGSHYFDGIDVYDGYAFIGFNAIYNSHGHGVRLRGGSLIFVGNSIVNPNISYPRLGYMFYGIYGEKGALLAFLNHIEELASPMEYAIYLYPDVSAIIGFNIFKGYTIGSIYGSAILYPNMGV